MRFKLKNKPHYGETREITRFALFPIMIDYEIRWLEFVRILQVFVEGLHYEYENGFAHKIDGWKSINFINQ